MHIVDPARILTVAEIAKLLQLDDESPITSAVQGGELPCVDIAGQIRVIGIDFNEYVAGRRSRPLNGNRKANNGRDGASPLRAGSNLQLRKAPPFTHRWPDETKEKFRDVLEGSVHTKNGVRAVKIGFTTRAAAGKDRERAVIFIDGRPMVEFCGADDYESSGRLGSIIKIQNKQVRPVQGIPNSYAHLPVDAYSRFVTGPYASSNLAVFCQKPDTEIMVEHALLRLEDIQARKGN